MKKSLPPKSDSHPSGGQAPQVPLSPSGGDAYKASTLMILLSIGGMIGTISLSCVVWIVAAKWKKTEFEIKNEKDDLAEISPVVERARIFLTSADVAKAAAIGAKSSGDEKGFSDTNEKVESALQSLMLPEKLSYIKPLRDSLQAIAEKNLEGMEIVKSGKQGPKWTAFTRDYQTKITNLALAINDQKEELEKQEKTRKQKLLDLAKEQRMNASGGLSVIWVTVAVILSAIGPLFLAWSTYRIVAHPIRLLGVAASRSISQGKPFEMKPTGPAEVRLLTMLLGSLVHGLEDRVLKRTEQLQAKAIELEQEMQQRKELETQLVFAQKMEAIGQLAAGIAHEVNTPSQYVCDNLRFLEEAVADLLAAVAPSGTEGETTDKPDAEELEFLAENAPGAVEQALHGMERITSIVKSMKNFAYRDASSEKKAQDLNQAIEATIVVATNEWKYHAELQIDLDPNIPFVPCNVGEINQVVLNLIVNASHAIRDANPDGKKGLIVVSTRQYDDFVVISIQDNGGGIPEEVQAKVFEPFFTTKDVGVGTGQGLAIAHNVITKSHGGHLWFETELGSGTTFFIRLPLQPVQEEAEA